MNRFRVALFLLCFTLACTTLVNAQTPHVTGLFGHLDYRKESGDVVGLEIFIVRGRVGYVAVIQIAEGVPNDPIVVPIIVKGGMVSFQIPNGKSRLTYEGTLRSDGLYGKFDNGAFSDRDDGYFLLKRGSSLWQE